MISNPEEQLGDEERKALHGEAYAERFEHAQSVERIERLVPLMSLASTDKIVDIGCGNALSMTVLNGKFNSYMGIDFSAPFIKVATARALVQGVENAAFYCGSAQDFAAENAERFDVALALDISEHVYDDEWLSILIAVRRMLVPGGRLYLHTPSLDFFIERMKDRNFFLRQFPEHIAVRSMKHNNRLLKESGLEIATARLLPHYNWLSVLHPLSRIPIIGNLFAARIFIEATKP